MTQEISTIAAVKLAVAEANKAKTPTAAEMVRAILEKLKPHFGKMLLKVDTGAQIGPHDSVYVTYASVPQGSPEIAALNARSNPMFAIDGDSWTRGEPAPAKVTVRHFRGNIDYSYSDPDRKKTIKFRTKTGTPDDVVEYLTDFFVKHKDALLRNKKS